MRALLLIGALFLGGCVDRMAPLLPETIPELQTRCDKNGGLERIILYQYGWTEVRCTDGAVFEWEREVPRVN